MKPEGWQIEFLHSQRCIQNGQNILNAFNQFRQQFTTVIFFKSFFNPLCRKLPIIGGCNMLRYKCQFFFGGPQMLALIPPAFWANFKVLFQSKLR